MTTITMNIDQVREYIINRLNYTAQFMPEGQYVDDHCSYECRVSKVAAIGLQMDGKIVALYRNSTFCINPIELRNPTKDETRREVEEKAFGANAKRIPHLSTWSCGGVITPRHDRTMQQLVDAYNSQISGDKQIIGIYEFD